MINFKTFVHFLLDSIVEKIMKSTDISGTSHALDIRQENGMEQEIWDVIFEDEESWIWTHEGSAFIILECYAFDC